MAEQNPPYNYQHLTFDPPRICSQIVDMTTGATEVLQIDAISFNLFDNDDHLKLGSVTLA